MQKAPRSKISKGRLVGKFHVVRFAHNDVTTDHQVYFENKPYLKVSKALGGMSRSMARALVKLLNGEARWPQ